MDLKIKFLNEFAQVPTYGSDFAAGLDLYSTDDITIEPQQRACVGTGIAVEWNSDCRPDSSEYESENYYLRIAPRSGLAYKHGIDVGAGVIDSDYRGEIKVILFNHGLNPFVIKKGDRIAQAILTRILRFNSISVVDNSKESELTNTKRGTEGFGSTGV